MKIRDLSRVRRAPGCVTRSFAAPRRAPDSFRWLDPGCLRQAARPICAALVCGRSYPAESFRRRLAAAAQNEIAGNARRWSAAGNMATELSESALRNRAALQES